MPLRQINKALPLLPQLKEYRIFEFYEKDGKLILNEMCDGWFDVEFDAEDLYALASEIMLLAKAQSQSLDTH
jgi:hypothetical protein